MGRFKLDLESKSLEIYGTFTLKELLDALNEYNVDKESLTIYTTAYNVGTTGATWQSNSINVGSTLTNNG